MKLQRIFLDLPSIPPAPTANEDLSGKPTCQADYKKVYQQAFQPTLDTEEYWKLYFTLQKKVDQEVLRVLKALRKSKFRDNTIVIFTSDHGDYLGSHGLFQKWYSAYEEAIHVPFMVYVPGLFHQEIDLLTSHIDIVPTILGLLGLNVKELQEKIRHRYTECRPLVGRDLSPVILGTGELEDRPQYFMTDDNVTKGLTQQTYNGQSYQAVIQPNSVETVIARIEDY